MSPTWIFDLDNTLHHADSGIFDIINIAMTQYMAQALDLELQDASDLRVHYWHHYGATLAGLKIHHPHVDVSEFLHHSHPLDPISKALVAEDNLLENLQQIAAPKIVFSNGPSFYVQHLLSTLKISDCFEAAYGIDDVNYLYKPEPDGFRLICEQHNLHPRHCIMVDDSLANLVTAKNMGMKTIWFGPQSHDNPVSDAYAHHLQHLLPIYLQWNNNH